MIRSDKGPYPRSLSHSPTTLTLVLLHTAGLSRNKSFDRPRGERHASFTIYTHAFSGRRRPLTFIFTRFKEDFRRWKLNREEGGNELSSSFKLNLCPAPAREQAIPSAVNLSSRRKLTFWSRPRSFVSLTGLLSTAHERTYQFHPRRRIDPHYYSSSSLFREKNPLCST